MQPINTILKARQAGQKIVDDTAKKETQNSKEFNEWAKSLESFGFDEEAFEPIEALLALPDDSFAILAPNFLEELEKMYSDEKDMMTLIRFFTTKGYDIEDVQQEYMAINEAIDQLEHENFSTQKKDFLKKILNISYNSIAGMDGIASKKISVPIELTSPDAIYPTYAHESDAGMDVYSTEDITIDPGETVLVPTGIKVAIPLGYELQVRPKSGRALKTKMRVANSPGTIDSGYRDEIKVIIENIEPKIKDITVEDGQVKSILYGRSMHIGKGEKFAQFVLCENPKISWLKVESVSEISGDRGGGFGSTGLK